MLTFLFWLFGIAAIYSYFIYPLVLRVLVAKAGVKTSVAAVGNATAVPSVSLIVTAYNEESRIRAKIENSLQLAFADAAFEIIIASDCSEDATDAIVREYAQRNVRLVRAPERLGNELIAKFSIANDVEFDVSRGCVCEKLLRHGDKNIHPFYRFQAAYDADVECLRMAGAYIACGLSVAQLFYVDAIFNDMNFALRKINPEFGCKVIGDGDNSILKIFSAKIIQPDLQLFYTADIVLGCSVSCPERFNPSPALLAVKRAGN